jgi:SAM-dependent methyltransferase
MEFNTEIFNKLLSLIESAKENKDYEFEVLFNRKNIISEENYNKIFQKLTFSTNNNGFGYSYVMRNILDVFLDKNNQTEETGNIRMSIEGTDNIKKYWVDSDSYNHSETIFVEKERIDNLDVDDYNLRFALKNELPKNNLLNKNKNLLQDSNKNNDKNGDKNNSRIEKMYRLKNRYSIKTDDGLFSIDMSSVKTGIGRSFKESNTLKENSKFEIEIELIDKKSDITDKEILKKLLYHCEIVLKILQNNNILITNSFINELKKSYNTLIKSKYPDQFIAASPVTIHIENLLKSENIKNIYSNYAVTLKADGSRQFLLVFKSDNPEINGKIFIFNNNFKFIDTGYVDTSWTNTLIECELYEANGDKELLMYDILFSKNEDVRRRHLIDIKKEQRQPTRLDILENFNRSTTRKLHSDFMETTAIKITTKKYIQSIRSDGTDIFQKVQELWDNRNMSSFEVDGIIFVPKYEYYPNYGGSWHSLFKWKPPELNTIDFLVHVFKDDNKKDIKNPYFHIITRPDGKTETIIKQYKTIQLYVSGTKTIYVKNQNQSKNQPQTKSIKKQTPVLFNPYGMDEKNSEIYNNAKIMIDDDDKMWAIDPITGEKVEIYDDIIVEFSYDMTAEEGFKWKPCRFRHDKTNLYKSGKDMFGNSEGVAKDIFKAINNPITEEMIKTGNIKIPDTSKDPGQSIINQPTSSPYYVREVVANNERRERFPYQNFHNHYIKYQLLYLTSPSYINEYKNGGFHGKMLDLCCGKGVDLNKIKRAKYAEVVGMDIDYQNIKDAQEYYKNIIPSPKPKAYFVRGDSSRLIWPEQSSGFTEADKIYTKKFIPSKYMFDTVSLQFCFHYFFKDEIAFRSILQNISDNLKIGGFVIGTTFDGERVYNALKSENVISGKTFSGENMWRIEKKYSASKFGFTDKRPNFGKEIDVFVKTIGAVHTEYLVNFNYVDKMMAEYGFSKISVKPFEDFYNELIEGKNLLDLSPKELEKDIVSAKAMSEAEKKFSFLSSGFIYKKEKNAPDSLMKKLVELIEKKDKLRTKDITVYKVDSDTEHVIEDSEIKEKEPEYTVI